MADFKVHRVRFFEFTPLTINCLAFDKATQRLAVSRSDGSIEVWSKPDNWFQEKVIAVAEEQSVEGVVWMNSRLFSAGLDSNVVEYDLSALSVKRQASSSAGAIWCIAKNEDDQQLAVGTEDGCVVLFDAADDKLEYLRSFDKLEGRILCIAWHTGESVVVTGGVDNIRLWSATSGHALQRITMGRDTIVWSIALTSDMTIISGDSRGKVTFWNGKQGTRITHFQSHRADVLTVCVDETESSVFCGGVDPSLVQFSNLASAGTGGWRSWVRGSVRTYHTHDVRACVVAGNTVVTGGVDTNLICSQVNNKKKRFFRHSSIPSMSMVGVAKKPGLVMLRYPTYLEMWRLGHTEASSSVNGDVLPLKFEPVKLVQLKARAGERIACSAISQDGTVCAFSDQEKIRVYRMNVEDKDSLSPKVSLSRLPLSPAPNGGTAQRLVIAPGNRRLVAATGALCVQIWDISGDKGTLLHSLQPFEAGLGDSKHHPSFTNLCVSEDGKMAASSDSGGGVHLYRLDDPQVVCRLPSVPCQASAINFSSGSKSLLVAYANHKVVEFDVHKQEYCSWSRQSRLPDQWFRQRGYLRGVTTQPSCPSTLFLHSDHNIMVIRRSQPMPDKDYVLFTGETTSEDSSPRPLVACARYKLILHMDFLDSDSLVVVERTPLSIQDKLAPALRAKKFGT